MESVLVFINLLARLLLQLVLSRVRPDAPIGQPTALQQGHCLAKVASCILHDGFTRPHLQDERRQLENVPHIVYANPDAHSSSDDCKQTAERIQHPRLPPAHVGNPNDMTATNLIVEIAHF